MSQITILFVADICGKPGRQATAHLTRALREEHGVDFVIANVENAAGGFGVTPEMSKKIFSYGVDLQTTGNHIWDRLPILEYLGEQPKLIRPANFPEGAPGSGFFVSEVGEVRIGVVNLQGRTYMKEIDCPFQVGFRVIESIRKTTDIIVVDFHAEATSEKQAFAYYMDGKVSAIVGTHTHVQTADEKISKRGTAYITDAGMTGPFDSIIGMDKGPSLGRFLTGMPKRFSTASDDVKMNAILLKVDASDGSAVSIERLQVDFNIADFQPQSSYGEG